MNLAPVPARKFITAGKSTFTLHSKATGRHLTFMVKKPKTEIDNPKAPAFVSVLTGPDNEQSFSYLGTIFADGNYRQTAASKIGADADSAKAFEWLWKNADKIADSKQADFLPASNCCRCGRKITHPESIGTGIGPECRAKMGL